jgi:hypothetical protein
MSPDPLSPIMKQDDDPVEFGALITNPQIWNRYAYVRNNPIYYRDPNGEFAEAAAVAARFAPVFMTPGVGEVAMALATIGVVGVEVYIYQRDIRNKQISKQIDGQYRTGLDNMGRHPQMDPNDPMWLKAIKEMEQIIKRIRELAAKVKNDALEEDGLQKAQHLEDLLNKAKTLKGGTTTAPKLHMQLIPDPRPKPAPPGQG